MEEISISQIAEKIIALGAENEMLKARLAAFTDVSRFYNVALSVPEVAKLHGCSDGRIREYVRDGYIETHPLSTDAKILIRASDALTLDLVRLRRERRGLGGRD